MKFKDLFGDVEEWFWKLELNPETGMYELFLGVPNDWMYSGNGKDIEIELFLEMKTNSIIKISALDESLTIDDLIDTAKLLVIKNKELEKKKEEHRQEMERLKNLLIEKEKSFLEFIDKVKDTKGDGETETEDEEENDNTEAEKPSVETESKEEEEVIVVEESEKEKSVMKFEIDTDNFINDIKNTKK